VQSPASEVPGLITQKIGFDFEGTLGLLKLDWTDKQEELLQHFPTKVKNHMLKNKTASNFSFMDEITWMDSYLVLLEHFKKGDSDWEELLFKLWILRVLNYTTTVALRGYDFSQRYLHEMVHRYRMKMGAEKILRNGK
jgi:mannosylglycerate synthase